uniref:Uncharacterized protein n=1 Tax=Anguilla anguilla TaxID=7936 RepID=A0A0E9T4R7_ANGAN
MGHRVKNMLLYAHSVSTIDVLSPPLHTY